MIRREETVIYLPLDAARQDRWDMVAASLRAAGFTNIQPAPMTAQTYRPRHVRQPILISRAGV